MKRTFYAAAALFILTVLSHVPLASAQTATGLKLQPALFEQRADPGQSFSTDLKVSNLSDQPQTLRAFVQDITNVDANGQPVFSQQGGEATGYELSSWVQLGQTSFTVAPGAVHDLTFTVAVPRGASPGGHFGAIVVEQQGSATKQTGAGVGYQVASLIELRISGNVVEDADVREFSVSQQVFSSAHVPFLTNVENRGNVLVRPQGIIEITNMLGKKVATVSVNDSLAGVFPKTSRAFDAAWSDDGFAFGRYQATLSLVYGEDGRKTISQTLSFWVLPMNVILPVLGAIIFIIVLILVLVKLYVRSKLRAAGATGRAAGGSWDAGTPGFGRVLLFTLIIAVIVVLLLIGLFLLF